MPNPVDHTYEVHSSAYHATASTALPTLPAAGAAITWSGGWTAVPFRFTSDPFTWTQADSERLEIRPPRQAVKGDVIENPEVIDSIEFTAYDIGKRAYQVATNWSNVGDVWTPSATHTPKAFAMEIKGIGIMYFPKVYIKFGKGLTGGRVSLVHLPGMIDVLYTTAITTGFQWHQIATTS